MLIKKTSQWIILILFVSVVLVTFKIGYIIIPPAVIPGSVVPSSNFDPQHLKDAIPPIIMVTYWGRMGNHMFEYAALIGIATRNNMIPVIPLDLDLLDIFVLPTQRGSCGVLGMFYTYHEVKAAAYFNKTENLLPYNTLLSGYYQSWKYFDDIKEDLLTNHFVFREDIKREAQRILQNALTVKNKHGAVLVGVHVRRGDFVRQTQKGYTAAPISYYYTAMNYFRRKFKNVLFIVCSNDVMWTEDNLDVGPDVHYSLNSGELDFAILTSCSHMIITSGSYSWWSGYLVRGEVVYFKGFPQPNTFIGNITVREDYYPPHWIAM